MDEDRCSESPDMKRGSKSRKGLLHKAEPESNAEKRLRHGRKQSNKNDLYSCVEEMRNLLLRTDIPRELPDEELDLFSSIFDAAFTSHASAQGLICSGQEGKGAESLARSSASGGVLQEEPCHVSHEEAVDKGREIFLKAVAAGAAWPSRKGEQEIPQERHIGQILQKIGQLQTNKPEILLENHSKERQALYENLHKFKKIAQRVSKIQNAVSAISRMKRAADASRTEKPPPLPQGLEHDSSHRNDSGGEADEETEDDEPSCELDYAKHTRDRIDDEKEHSSSAQCSSDDDDGAARSVTEDHADVKQETSE